MTNNVGTTDRMLRIILGLALIVSPLVGFMGTGANSTVAYTMMAIGAILTLTGLFGTCPMYSLLGIRTRKS